jgi:zinc protease
MKALYCGALLALASAAMAASDGDYKKITEKKLFNGETLYEFRLPNDFRVLHVPRHTAKVLTYQVWFNVGSNDEKLDPKLKKTGLAHLFEHMMFRGSKKYPDGKFDEITSRIGGDKQNATTYYYRTNYYESVPSQQLDRIMELEADRMKNLNLNSELFEKEKGAVVGELRRALDNPMRKANDDLMRLVYKQAPFQWTVLGSEEEIKGFTLEEAQYFYKTYYAPNNATLIVVGDVTPTDLMKLVVKHYGGMERQKTPEPPVVDEPKQDKERTYSDTHRQATSEILNIAYRVPSLDSPDTIPLSLLTTHLSTGMESRFRKVLIDKGIAVSASAGVSNMPDLLEVTVQLAEKRKAEEALRIVDKEIAALKAKAIDKKDFERARNQELLNLYNGIGSNSEMGNWLGEYLMISGNYMRGFEIIEGFSTLKPADLQRVAKQYLNASSRSIVIIRPGKEDKS